MTVPAVASTSVTAADVRLGRGTGARMRARAHVSTELRPVFRDRARSRVATLHSEAPLVLRILRAGAPQWWTAGAEDVVRVARTAGAAGPVGGDELALTVDVGAGSSLVFSEISPSLLLPGPHGAQSHMTVRIRVATGGTLIWSPEPMIAAHGCDHLNEVEVDLEEGARFFMREEFLLGRHGETSGQVRQRTSVRLAGLPLYRQDLQMGTADARTPTVVGEYQAVGSSLIVDPSWGNEPRQSRPSERESSLMPLAGPAVLITAVGHDNIQVRRHLEAGLVALGAPWGPSSGHR